MRAINHALTGAVIGIVVGNPIALPIAFLSHFLLDAIPHHSYEGSDDEVYVLAKFKYTLLLDALLCFVLVIVLGVVGHVHWQLAVVCAFLATSPDFFHIPSYVKTLKDQPYNPGIYSRFASRIQWFQKPIGAYVEVAWAFATVVLLAKIL